MFRAFVGSILWNSPIWQYYLPAKFNLDLQDRLQMYRIFCSAALRVGWALHWAPYTLRTPWPWQKYCLNYCTRMCCSLRIVTRCCFTNWPIRCKRGGRNVHFLSIKLISFRWSCGILFWLWLSRCGRWTLPVDSEIQRKMCEMLGISSLKGYQVDALEAVCLKKCDTLVCVPTGSRNSACFEIGLICTVIDHVTVSEQAA